MRKYFILQSVLILLAMAACKTSSHTQKQSTPATTGKQATATPSGKPEQTVDLPVFIPIMELQTQLYQSFFAPNYGKYYPCEGHDDCADAYKNLYVENPVLHVNGNKISIKMHLAGKADLVVLSSDVSEDITFNAQPRVKNDTLFFDNITMDHSSSGILMKLASVLFEKRIIAKIQENAWYAFRPKLDAMTADSKKHFPLKWGNICLLLDLGKVTLKDVRTCPQPNEGILADFSAQLIIQDASFCGQ